MKKAVPFVLGLAMASVLAVPAFADHMNARVKAVDTTANTITVIEGGKDYVYSVSAATHFLNAKGGELANGIKSGDLRPGTRLSIEYTKTNDNSLASEVKLRGPLKAAAPASPAEPPK